MNAVPIFISGTRPFAKAELWLSTGPPWPVGPLWARPSGLRTLLRNIFWRLRAKCRSTMAFRNLLWRGIYTAGGPREDARYRYCVCVCVVWLYCYVGFCAGFVWILAVWGMMTDGWNAVGSCDKWWKFWENFQMKFSGWIECFRYCYWSCGRWSVKVKWMHWFDGWKVCMIYAAVCVDH